jgi:hypothetical protein
LLAEDVTEVEGSELEVGKVLLPWMTLVLVIQAMFQYVSEPVAELCEG